MRRFIFAAVLCLVVTPVFGQEEHTSRFARPVLGVHAGVDHQADGAQHLVRSALPS